jgi:hypothetical protein
METVITGIYTSEAAVATGVILAAAAAAFGIKGLWVAWRAGSKAMSKVGS